MEGADLARRLQTAAAADLVLQQELARAAAAEQELQHNARQRCSAVVEHYLAERAAAASAGSAPQPQIQQQALQQASSMLEEFLARRAQLWSAQLRSLPGSASSVPVMAEPTSGIGDAEMPLACTSRAERHGSGRCPSQKETPLRRCEVRSLDGR